jgi:molybdopterin molybdotransferase
LARQKGFQKLTTVDHALKMFLKCVKIVPRDTVQLPLHSSLNRILAENVKAIEDLPRFDRSAVDGFAVKARDTVGCTQFRPKQLKVTQEQKIACGQAKQLLTGGAIPEGADAVVMLENTREASGNLEIWKTVVPHENVSRQGEDVKEGEIALQSGLRLRSHHLGMMAALGRGEVSVYERPIVAILATGNELVEVDCKPTESQVFEANKHVLIASCEELGASPLDLGIAEDNLSEITERLRHGLCSADAIITTGGTSVGLYDLVPDAVNKIKSKSVIVHGVALRPAMPTALAAIGGKPILILSGNPVAAIVGFEVFGRPLISKMLGLRNEERRPVVKAKLTRRVSTSLGRLNFVRVRVLQIKNEFYAEPVSSKGSNLISTMTKANGFAIVPKNREGIDKNEEVLVSLFDSMEVSEKYV